MEKNSFLQFINRQKYLAVKIGLGVAIIHFLVVYFVMFVGNPSFGSFTFIVLFLLETPSYLLILNNFEFSNSEILMIIFSSFFYGVFAGLLTSKIPILQTLAFILIGLLILSFLYAITWAGGIFA